MFKGNFTNVMNLQMDYGLQFPAASAALHHGHMTTNAWLSSRFTGSCAYWSLFIQHSVSESASATINRPEKKVIQEKNNIQFIYKKWDKIIIKHSEIYIYIIIITYYYVHHYRDI